MRHQYGFLLLLITSIITPSFAHVRKGTALAHAEKEFIEKRAIFTNKALQRFFLRLASASSSTKRKEYSQYTSLTLEETPRIAVVAGGGGHKSLMSTLGFLIAMEELGLLDCISYISTESGASWCLASWIAKNNRLYDYADQLEENIYQFFDLNGFSPSQLLHFLIRSKKEQETPTFCDAWGRTVCSFLFAEDKPSFKDDNPDQIDRLSGYGAQHTLSSLGKTLNPNHHPFPLFTALFASIEPVEWMEFTPFEIGSPFVNGFISTEFFGSDFSKGKITNQHLELPLHYLLGLVGTTNHALNFGLAFDMMLNKLEDFIGQGASQDIALLITESISEITSEIQDFTSSYFKKFLPKNTRIQNFLTRQFGYLQNLVFDKATTIESRIPNFTYGIGATPFSREENYRLVDASSAPDLPIPPLMRKERGIDLYIVCDTQGACINPNHIENPLIKAEQYARRKRIPFPRIKIPLQETKGSSKIKQSYSKPYSYDRYDPTKPIILSISAALFEFKKQGSVKKLQEFQSIQEHMKEQTHASEEAIIAAIIQAINNKKEIIEKEKEENEDGSNASISQFELERIKQQREEMQKTQQEPIKNTKITSKETKEKITISMDDDDDDSDDDEDESEEMKAFMRALKK